MSIDARPTGNVDVDDLPASLSSEFHSGVRFADDLVRVFDNLRFDSDDSFDDIDDFDSDEVSDGFGSGAVYSASPNSQVQGL